MAETHHNQREKGERGNCQDMRESIRVWLGDADAHVLVSLWLGRRFGNGRESGTEARVERAFNAYLFDRVNKDGRYFCRGGCGGMK